MTGHFYQARPRKLGVLLLPYGVFALMLLATLSSSRALLTVWQLDRVLDADMLGNVLLQGLRFDLVLLGFLLAWPILFTPLMCTSRLMMRIWRPTVLIYLIACFAVVVFLEAATAPFIDQFDARPNRLFFEYIAYPKEIVSTLKAAYLTELALASLLVSGAILLARRLLGSKLRRTEPVGLIAALVVTPILLFSCIVLGRSTLDHRAVNPSTVALSTDPMVNDLALNSTYTLLYALEEKRAEPQGGFRYSDMPKAKVVDEIRATMTASQESFTDDSLPTLHYQTASRQLAKPKNLVIVLEESLGAEFVGSLGGLPLTPRLDALAEEGMWFENLYATGTRSVRGIEAVITGFTPTPARSVVKLGGSQRGFFTIAQLLGSLGYDTSFIYGGEAQFDNMRRFFMNNGFAKVIDEDDYDDAVFLGSWGASDEDLFRHAHAEFSKPREKPFFSLVFSTSNHTPYEFPDGRIELYDQEKNTVNNAVKYADYALGQFIDMAKASNYWKDTVFLIISDHNSRVYGADLVPVEHFHIPGLILGADIAPAMYEPVASQIDLPPTLLSLIGVSASHPMIGHDLTLAEPAVGQGRAIMQYNGTQAYMRGNQIVVMRKDLPPEEFTYDGTNLVPNAVFDPELAELGLAHANWSSMAYEEKLYRLPTTDSKDRRLELVSISPQD
jgi:phosphoglycerol transferase MdoB-like AlkP superfamily enzyme